ncbi:retinoblastoma-associated protein-like [Sinocyclocheilus rhinocerous]|uniref:retinoblastoma-associated protein-like n=1 Tax=Sinocyclocheilus rhinocerous TaxID=307959 RepID=UPI0007B99D48|nr:PREDICTED: retinoblastoma-associated protein-like [Sinocyclocheilus rhinocerous]
MPPKKRSSGTPQKKELKGNMKSGSPDSSENAVLSPERHKDKEPEFVSLSEELQATNPICDHAWRIWEREIRSMDKANMPYSNRHQWGACLFIAGMELDGISLTFTQFLKVVGLSVKQFISLVRKMDVNVDTISPKVNTALKRLENKYNVTLALYQRFVKTCEKISAEPDKAKRTELWESSWTMFLLAKGTFLQMEDDLVIAFQLLLCVLEFFTKRFTPSLLQSPYKSAVSSSTLSPPTRTSRRNQGKAKPRPPEMDVQLLVTLCKESDCSVDEVKNVYQTTFCAFLDSVGLSGLQVLPPIETLSKQYEELYHKNKDFDARLFLVDDETLSPNKTEVSKVEMTPRKNLSGDDVAIPVPQTPIRAAMNSIQQLRVDLTSASDQPSSNLLVYYKNCTVDPTEEIRKRVEELGQVFIKRFAQAVGQHCEGLGRKRFNLGAQLYYKVMESMLTSEEKRLSVQNFSKLLNNAAFHTSLLACALEVVMATYVGNSLKSGGFGRSSGASDSVETDLCFPWILDVFQLPAFDFYKVIESFIKAEPTLKHDMMKHLEQCEHVIMESLAWKADSPLFDLLKQSREEGPGEQAEPPATLNQPLHHNHTAADLYLSPVRPSHQPPATEAEPPTPGTKALRSDSLSLFYKKLYRMAYMRLKTLFSHLLTSHPELEPIIWTLLQHTLQNEYELMRDRHLDQLIMSAMYAICKVKNVDLRFKTIVTAYKEMPNTNQETFKRVLIREGQYDSIIVFYNLVFMQKLKTNILQYSSPRPPPLSPIPRIPCSPYKNSPLRVPGSNNVYVSPLKSSRMSPVVMTPRSRILISIGESFGSADKFQKINEMVSSTNWSLKRSLNGGSAPKPLKRLRFDMDGQDEADGSKSSGESTLIQKLAEMSSTRTRMQEQKLKEESVKEHPEP